MKTFTLLFAVVLIATIQALEFSEELKTKMRENHKECSKESGLSEADINKIHNFPRDGDDEQIRKHLVCLGKRINFLNEDGTLNPENIKTKLREIKVSDEQIEKIMKDCITKKSTMEKTMARYLKCEHEIIGKFDLKLFD